MVVHGEPLPEVINLAQLGKCFSAGGSICLVDPEFELGTCRRAEGSSVEVGRHGWGQNDGRSPAPNQFDAWIMSSCISACIVLVYT